MKFVVKKSEAKVLAEHGVSKFTEYPVPFKNFSIGVSEINGRYPVTGFDVDTKIEACWYVISGFGEINIGNDTHSVDAGDMVFVPKGEKFWIKGKNLKLVVTSSPAWYPKQHQHIE